ncbi:hypothetical protein LTR86_008075 [Recurvomyces mirabilis]|nr:hypothetical protein LTR86_008075 [Recurvomyces mirabilis]
MLAKPPSSPADPSNDSTTMNDRKRSPASIGTYSQAIPSCELTILNENWRGKTDRLERRRIQNRLNQRAFRERQRSSPTPPSDVEQPAMVATYKKIPLLRTQSDPALTSASGSCPTSVPEHLWMKRSRSSSPAHISYEREMFRHDTLEDILGEPKQDELGYTINRNLFQAAFANAGALGISAAAIETEYSARTSRSICAPGMTQALIPIELQYTVEHDQFIDIIPHPRFRYNVLTAIAASRSNVTSLIGSLRRSGLVVVVNGARSRDGVVIWGPPDNFRSWEISEAFYSVWKHFLVGCDDWLQATNVWRARRAERALLLCT